MRLRLPEHTQQRKQQSAPHQPDDATFWSAELYVIGEARRSLKKNLKKVLTFIGEIQYERGWLQKRQRIFAR
jgi:hypothetical protein